MAWSPYHFFLAGLMMVSGSLNTLTTKWADITMSKGCNTTLPEREFDHPFLQATGMFVGEMLCLLVFQLLRRIWLSRLAAGRPTPQRVELLVNGNQDFRPWMFIAPAMCDIVGTSLMYIGLNMTYASSYQMLRGSAIIFTALLSVAFLRRTINVHMGIGIALVVLGLASVGASDFLLPKSTSSAYDLNRVITGDELIIMAQIVGAVQVVLEERFVSKYNVLPLQAVGWEGVFGFITLSLLLIPMHFIRVGSFSTTPSHLLEDVPDAFCQMQHNWVIPFAVSGNIVSIAFFNFAGISVTRELSATTRMVLDCMRTLVVYVVSLGLHWQGFHYLQVIGFVLLVLGTLVYNGAFNRLWRIVSDRTRTGERAPLIQ